jgi:putative ABC transport system permease protein
MLLTYFKTAWRNLVRYKTFSLLTISGLALGITCSFLIMLWVLDEHGIDAFHANGKYLYQVYERNYYDGKVEAAYTTQGLLADELKRVIPEIQFASALERASAPGTLSTFEAGNKIIKMEGSFAGEDFFSMFSYPLLQGTAQTALAKQEAIAISLRMAEQFFDSPEIAIGKTIRYENREDLLVTAVFKNIPANSSQRFDFLRSWTAFVKENQWVHNWGNTSPLTFVQLRKDADAKKTEAKIREFIYRYQPKNEGSRTELALQPYPEKYLYSHFKNGYVDGGRIEYVRLFTMVAIFILLIACINFMNLATARASKRAKEVGVRKVIGAPRIVLVWQFMGEAVLLTFFSMIIAVCLTILLLPAFNSLTGKQVFLPFSSPLFWTALVGLLFVTGFVAGSYPALFLSSLNPIRVLKGNLKFSASALFFRKGLVIFQFSLSIILIVGTMVIYRQMQYVQSKNLGYDRENLLYLPIEGDLVKNYGLFKEEAGQIPGILAVSKMRNSPTLIEHHTGSIEWPGKAPNLAVSFADAVVGYDFVKTMKLQLKEGRDFSMGFGTDSASFLVNETAVAKIGFQNPIGQQVAWGNRRGKIIGVLKDFHFNSMHSAIEPLIVRLDEAWTWGTILIRIKGDKTKEVIAGLEKLCKTLNPKVPFTYQFSDEEYTKLYKSEQIVSKLSGYFAFLAIFISCLGLFGLAMFAAVQRTKEIGIRKVLGASIPGIVTLLTSSFLKPVFIALVIAIPVALYIMKHWLQDFAYKIDIEWWMLATAGMTSVSIALITVSFQAVKAAMTDPVKNLRTE